MSLEVAGCTATA